MIVVDSNILAYLYLPGPWAAAMEATLVSSWIYRSLKPLADQLLMGNPARMKAITAGKKKSDKIDARTIADLLRCDEVILSGTTIELFPVVAIDGKPVADGKPGPISRKLQAGFRQAVADWLAKSGS